jgi:hypothetical protein
MRKQKETLTKIHKKWNEINVKKRIKKESKRLNILTYLKPENINCWFFSKGTTNQINKSMSNSIQSITKIKQQYLNNKWTV